MYKLCLGISFAAVAMLVACGDDNGSGSGNVSIDEEWVEQNSSDTKDSSSSDIPESSSSRNISSSSGNSSSSITTESSSSVLSSSSDGSIYDATANTLTDLRDNQVYRTTTIDIPSKNYSEVWMAENLNIETENSWCGGGNGTTEGDCSVYGRLYTWLVAVEKTEDECGVGHACGLSGMVRGICPKGWHLPNRAEWEELIIAVDGSIALYDPRNTAGIKLKSTSGWNGNNGESGNGTDAYSFSALPAGKRSSNGDGYYSDGGNRTYMWSTTEDNIYNDNRCAYALVLYYEYEEGIHFNYDNALLGTAEKENSGYSIRCLKD